MTIQPAQDIESSRLRDGDDLKSSARLSVSISLDQAIKLIHKHYPEHRESNVRLLHANGPHHSHPRSRVYVIDISTPNDADVGSSAVCFLIVSTGNTDTDNDKTATNTLTTVASLNKLIREHTDMPLPVHTLDNSLSIIPYNYLLSPLISLPAGHILISLSEARRAGLLPPVADARLDLRVGQYLGQLHVNVQNDWFGIPQSPQPTAPASLISSLSSLSLKSSLGPPGGDAAYSWQETFVSIFETVLYCVEERIKTQAQSDHLNNGTTKGIDGVIQHKLPTQDIHRHLSRAISFFLFDDVEVPSLVTLTTSIDDVFISLPAATSPLEAQSEEPPSAEDIHIDTDTDIRYIVPNLTHALWGDPLLESIFTPPGPSMAVREGYVGAGGGPLIVFARQKTKRLWYTLFSALLVLAESGVVPKHEGGGPGDRDKDGEQDKVVLAWDTVEKCVEALKDAPYY
ncbi:hypothetical protein AX17_004809 [Amanita inopinata Kibby_2008]|nr:hypothetical protein AX17_004809 [Amanita inopinata Kibby_2008]